MPMMCHSCAAPLDNPMFKGVTENLCKHCTDEKGNLKPRSEVQRGIAEWMKTWMPEVDNVKAMRRADFYMRSMPIWADK